MKHLLLSLLTVLALLPATIAHAGTWNTDKGGLVSTGTQAVIKGYDPVAYFTQGAATKGDPEISTQYDGGTFFFSSAANRDLFVKNPTQYSPQYGGYCAYAVGAKNQLVDVDPTAWKIVDGKLYLNYDSGVQSLWGQNIEGYIASGDKNWTGLKGK